MPALFCASPPFTFVCVCVVVVQYVVCVIVPVGRDTQHVGRLSAAARPVSRFLLGSCHPCQCQVISLGVSLLCENDNQTCAFPIIMLCPEFLNSIHCEASDKHF